MSGSPKLWLTGGGVALVALGVSLGVLPRFRALERLNREAVSLSARASRAETGSTKLVQLTEHLTKSRVFVERRIRPIPPDADVAGLIRTFTSELDNLGMTEREITTGASKDLGDALSAPMSVRMTGTFLSVYKSIRWIEALPRLVRITRIKIETPQRTPDDLFQNAGRIVRAELLLNFYSDPALMEPTDATASAESQLHRSDDP